MKNFEKNAAANPFFKKVWDSQKDWAAVAIPFWARAQTTNAAMGGAYAEVLRKGAAKPAPAKAATKKVLGDGKAYSPQ